MEVGNAVHRGNLLVVATGITLGVGRVDQSFGVERLVDVANVVDDQAQGKGELVGGVGERRGNLLVVCGASVVASVGQHANQGIQCSDEVGGWLHERVVVSVLVVWLINEVPCGLPAVAHALDVVSEQGALGEWMSTFVGCQGRIVCLQSDQLVESSLQGSWVVLLEDSLSLSGN